MGQFKPMVKMMTTEPSVVLKLKKGGSVSKKHGHKMMNGGVMAGLAEGPAPSRMQMGQGALPIVNHDHADVTHDSPIGFAPVLETGWRAANRSPQAPRLTTQTS